MPGLHAGMMILADCSTTSASMMACLTNETQSSVVSVSKGVAFQTVLIAGVEFACETAASEHQTKVKWVSKPKLAIGITVAWSCCIFCRGTLIGGKSQQLGPD